MLNCLYTLKLSQCISISIRPKVHESFLRKKNSEIMLTIMLFQSSQINVVDSLVRYFADKYKMLIVFFFLSFLFCCPQVKNHINVHGKGVSGGSHDRTSWHDITANTREQSLSNVVIVSVAFRGRTISRFTWSATSDVTHHLVVPESRCQDSAFGHYSDDAAS